MFRILPTDDHGSFVIFRSASVRPRHLIDQNFDHDYFFKLPLQGAGCPFTSAMFYCTPCLISSCPAYEPNSKEGEYSHPFRHIQYKRIASRRPIATFERTTDSTGLMVGTMGIRNDKCLNKACVLCALQLPIVATGTNGTRR